MQTSLMKRFNLSCPIIQAPMAGGGDTPALVAAVAEAGGMGFIGANYSTPAQIAEASQAVRDRSNRAFGINLFAPQPAPPPPAETGPALARLAPYHDALGLPAPTPPTPPADAFDALLAAALDSGAASFSFTSGIPPRDAVAAIKQRGMFLMGTATTPAEAVALEAAGCDAIVTQGAEAGGHRSTFDGEIDTGLIGTMALVPQVVDAVSVPVVASGGIMDGRGIAAALTLGAEAVQMGTAFLTCDEAGVPDSYKAALLAAGASDTRLTSAFSGKPARGVVNRFMTEVEFEAADDDSDGILPFPYQNALTRPLRAAAAQQDRAEFLSLWAGQGVGLSRRRPAAELIDELMRELQATLNRLRV